MPVHFRKLRPGEPNWSLKVKEAVKAVECEICHRLFEEHSQQEFSDHMDEIAEKQGRGWRKKNSADSKP